MLTCFIVDNSISSLKKISPHEEAVRLIDLQKMAIETILKVKKQQSTSLVDGLIGNKVNSQLSPGVSNLPNNNNNNNNSRQLTSNNQNHLFVDQYYCLMTTSDTLPYNIIVRPTDKIGSVQNALRSIKPTLDSNSKSINNNNSTKNYSNLANKSSSLKDLRELNDVLENCFHYLQLVRNSSSSTCVANTGLQSNDYLPSSCGHGRLFIDMMPSNRYPTISNNKSYSQNQASNINNNDEVKNDDQCLDSSSSSSMMMSSNQIFTRDPSCLIIMFTSIEGLSQSLMDLEQNHNKSKNSQYDHHHHQNHYQERKSPQRQNLNSLTIKPSKLYSSILSSTKNDVSNEIFSSCQDAIEKPTGIYDRIYHWDQHVIIYNMTHSNQHSNILNKNLNNHKQQNQSSISSKNWNSLYLLKNLLKDSMISIVNLDASISDVIHLAHVTHHQLNVSLPQMLNWLSTPIKRFKIRLKRIPTSHDDVLIDDDDNSQSTKMSKSNNSDTIKKPFIWQDSVVNIMVQRCVHQQSTTTTSSSSSNISKSQSNYWPLPETWIKSYHQTNKNHKKKPSTDTNSGIVGHESNSTSNLTMPLRESIPTLGFVCKSLDAIHHDQFPFDKFELEDSPLTRYIIQHVPPSKCWQLFITHETSTNYLHLKNQKNYMNSDLDDNSWNGSNAKQFKINGSSKTSLNQQSSNDYDRYSFGYLRTSINQQSVRLFLMPFNYTTLIPLVDELIMSNKGIPSNSWSRRFDSYLQSVPLYYLPYLRNAFAKYPHVFGSSTSRNLDSNHIHKQLLICVKDWNNKFRILHDHLSYSLNHHDAQKNQKNLSSCASLIDKSSEDSNCEINYFNNNNNRNTLTTMIRYLRPLSFNVDQPKIMKCHNSRINKALTMIRSNNTFKKCPINMKHDSDIFSQTHQNKSFNYLDNESILNFNIDDLSKENVDTLLSSWASMIQSSGTNDLSHMLLHHLPPSKATNYVDYISRETSQSDLRDIFPLPARINMFGNPFKLKPMTQGINSTRNSNHDRSNKNVNDSQIKIANPSMISQIRNHNNNESNKKNINNNNIDDIDNEEETFEHDLDLLEDSLDIFDKNPLDQSANSNFDHNTNLSKIPFDSIQENYSLSPSSVSKMIINRRKGPLPHNFKYSSIKTLNSTKNLQQESIDINSNYNTIKKQDSKDILDNIVQKYDHDLDTIYSENEISSASGDELFDLSQENPSKIYKTLNNSMNKINGTLDNCSDNISISKFKDHQHPDIELEAKKIKIVTPNKYSGLTCNYSKFWLIIAEIRIMIKKSRNSSHIVSSIIESIDSFVDDCKSSLLGSNQDNSDNKSQQVDCSFLDLIAMIIVECQRYKRHDLINAISKKFDTILH